MYYKQKQSDGTFTYFESDLELDIEIATKLTQEEIKGYLLQKAKTDKLAQLDSFHASEEVKILTIKLSTGATTKIHVDQDTRYLLDEQIYLLNLRKKKGELDPKWTYQNGISLPLTLEMLEGIRLFIGNLVDKNFKTKLNHQKTIQNLNDIKSIENYDFKKDYLINQILPF